MRYPLHTVVFVACMASMCLLILAGSAVASPAVQESPTAVLLDLLNEARLAEGLDPYLESRLLTDAAQRHADDVAANGFADPDDVHLGSDGSDEQERIGDAGYAAWTEDDGLMVDEIVWSGRGDPEDALVSLLDDPFHRDTLLSDVYREIGLGSATDTDGRSVYVFVFGARPNVLPIFINDGADTTEDSEVAIRLTNERARPEGGGTSYMGEAIEVRISDEPAFEGLAWQAWAPLVSWIMPDSPGEHTVYVEFRDAAGRTAVSADNITLDTGTPITATAAPSTPTSETTTSPAPETTATGVPQTPGGSDDVLSTPVPTLSSSSQDSIATPFPTWTPLPSPQPVGVDLAPSRGATASPTAVETYKRPLAIIGILQGTAVLLGVYLMMRRDGRARGE